VLSLKFWAFDYLSKSMECHKGCEPCHHFLVKRMNLINEVKMLLNADEIRDEESSGPVDQRLISRDIVGQDYNLSGSSVARYLKVC